MFTQRQIDEAPAPSPVSTGHLPPDEQVQQLVNEAYNRFKAVDEGQNAQHYPALARAPRNLFGICVASTYGALFAAGDVDIEFTIMSVAKPFVFALVCQALGAQEVRSKVGVDATGLPFNSVMAVELDPDRLTNPMVNSGAIATTSLAPGATAAAKWQFVQEGYRALQVARLRSTKRCTSRRRHPIIAIRGSPGCSRVLSVSILTHRRRSMSTPSRVHSTLPSRIWL